MSYLCKGKMCVLPDVLFDVLLVAGATVVVTVDGVLEAVDALFALLNMLVELPATRYEECKCKIQTQCIVFEKQEDIDGPRSLT